MAISGITINSPNTDILKKKTTEIQDKVKDLQMGGDPIATMGKTLWDNVVKPKLMTHRQIVKKMLIMSGQAYPIPIDEETAQEIVYGKIYYKNGKLYDNDIEDPNCVAQPGDEDYEPPMDESHPIWQKITNIFDEIKNSLEQLGAKIKELLSAAIAAIPTIIVSLTALISSAIILPFGSGLPTALSAVQTMMKTIKDLQAKIAEILPFLNFVNYLALVLPLSAQGIIAAIEVIISMITGVVTAVNIPVGMLTTVTSKLGSASNKLNNLTLKIDPTFETVEEGIKLSANAAGGDFNFTYMWTELKPNGTSETIAPNPTMEDDDGTRIVSPLVTTTYNCKVTDGKNATKEKIIVVQV